MIDNLASAPSTSSTREQFGIPMAESLPTTSKCPPDSIDTRQFTAMLAFIGVLSIVINDVKTRKAAKTLNKHYMLYRMSHKQVLDIIN